MRAEFAKEGGKGSPKKKTIAILNLKKSTKKKTGGSRGGAVLSAAARTGKSGRSGKSLATKTK